MLLFKTGSPYLALKQRRFKRIRKKKSHSHLTEGCLRTTVSAKRDQPLHKKHSFPFPHPIHCLQPSCQQKILAFSHFSVELKISPHFHTVFITFKCWQTWLWLREATLTKGKSLLYLPALLPWSLSPISLEKAGQTVSEILQGKSLDFCL